MKIVLFVILLCSMVFELSVAFKRCTSDKDCKYSRCDQNIGICKCDISCNHYNKKHKVCTNFRKQPIPLCQAINKACVDYQDYSKTLLKIRNLEDRKKKNCKPPFLSYENHGHQFCSDQSYCKGNGICRFHSTKGEVEHGKYCHCDINHEGDRCQIHLSKVYHDQSPGHKKPLAAVVLLLGAFVFITIGAVMVLVQRCRKTRRSTHESLDEVSTENGSVSNLCDNKDTNRSSEILTEHDRLWKH